jgi:hypothetical protein
MSRNDIPQPKHPASELVAILILGLINTPLRGKPSNTFFHSPHGSDKTAENVHSTCPNNSTAIKQFSHVYAALF